MTVSPLLLASIGLGGILLGRLAFDRWFNHFSLYSLIWGVGLALFEMKLIDYRSLTVETWIIVGYAWLAFAVGSVTVILAKTAVGAWPEPGPAMELTRNVAREKKLLVFFIIVLSSIGLCAVSQHWSVLLNRFGGVSGVLMSGYKIYRMRNANQIPGLIPYLDAFSLTATFLAGVYSARTRKIGLLALFPLLSVVLEDIGLVGRAKMLNAGILFGSGYFLTKLKTVNLKNWRPINKFRRLFVLSSVALLFLIAAEFVRTSRGAFESFYGTSRQLSKFERSAIITPSLYMYLSSHVGVLNAYWEAGGENPFPGSNTFAPVFRILSRFEIADDVPYYQKFYNTPINTNTGTYLREIHADFGLGGIIIGPYLLGFFCTFLWCKIKRFSRLTAIAVLTHFYVIVAFSFLYQVTRLGYWFVSFFAAVIVSYFIDHCCQVKATEKS